MLIVDDKWLLIGPNRHGSLWSTRVLQAAFRTRPAIGDSPRHTPLCKIPEQTRRGLTVVGIIRCPLRWYLSKWRIYWNTAIAKGLQPIPFCEFWEAHWLDPHGVCGKNTEDMPLPRAEIGAWSYHHIAYHCLDAPAMLRSMSRAELAESYPSRLSADELMHTETLNMDIARVFGPGVWQHFHKARNGSGSGQFLGLYTREMLRAVRERDGWLAGFYPQFCCHERFARC